jgi:hypothetical protein
MCDDAEYHGDRDDSDDVIGSRTAQLFQGEQAEHHRGQAAGTELGHQGDRGPIELCAGKPAAIGTIRSRSPASALIGGLQVLADTT